MVELFGEVESEGVDVGITLHVIFANREDP